MSNLLKIGLKGRQDLIVTEDKTARALGSGGVDVYATPAMIALMEQTARDTVQEYLQDGETTVGTLVNVKHLAATPLNEKVTCEAELVEIDRKRLVFKVIAKDEYNVIGEGMHERFIINLEKFMNKLNDR